MNEHILSVRANVTVFLLLLALLALTVVASVPDLARPPCPWR